MAVTPRGWFGYSGRLPYSDRDTGAITPDRPDLGGSVRAVITFDAATAVPWRRIPGVRGDLTRGRSMPRNARRLVLSAADRDLEPLAALLAELRGTSVVLAMPAPRAEPRFHRHVHARARRRLRDHRVGRAAARAR